MVATDREKRELGLATFLKDEVEARHADMLLFTCCLTSGLVDSTIYNGARVTHSVSVVDSTDHRSVQHVRVHADG